MWKISLRTGAYDSIATLDAGSGAVFVAGTTYKKFPGPGDFLAVKLKARNGSIAWEKNYDGPSGFDDPVHDAVLAPDETTFYVAGNAQDFSKDPVSTVAFDASTGARNWSRTSGRSQGATIALPTSRSLLMVGASFSLRSGPIHLGR